MIKYYTKILFLSISIQTVFGNAPVVDTTHGKVKGKVLQTLFDRKEYFGYMGIPYAEPPIEEFRFLPPRPLKPWDGVLKATQDTRPCLQYNYNVKKGQPLGHYGTPDCLYLDIFTPANPHAPLPLIVFLYNEQFRQSHNKTKDYSPDFFIENDVLIATISHRLSAFGFLSFEDELLHGNSGLRDIVAALKWIRNNAERFGGDPNRITLMGSQGGAAATELLIHSKERNLFNSVILQGGTAFESMYLKIGARERAYKLAEIFQKGSSSSDRLLKALNEISPGDLLEKEFQVNPQDYSKEHQRGLLPFGPVVEQSNGLITNYPELSETVGIPIMVGFNSREGLEKSLQYLIEPNFLGSVNRDFVLLLPWRVDFRFDPLDSSYEEAVNQIKRFYFPNEQVTAGNIAEYVTYIGDVTMSAIDHAAKHYANKADRIFYYHFDYYSELNENMNDLLKFAQGFNKTGGAASGDELCYLFKCPRLKKKYLELHEESPQAIVQKKLVRMWSNFVKYGEPTPVHDTLVGGLKWRPYNKETKEYLHIGNEIETKSDLYRTRFEFWEHFIAKWQSRAIGGVVRSTYKDEL